MMYLLIRKMGIISGIWRLGQMQDITKKDLHQESVLYIDDPKYRETIRSAIVEDDKLKVRNEGNKLIVVYK